MCTSATISTKHLLHSNLLRGCCEDKEKLAMLGKDCQHIQRDFEAKEQLPSAQCDHCDEEPMNRYEILADLGGGAYGTVYKAKDKEEDKIVALKKISVLEDPEIPGYPPFVVREVANLRRLSSDKHIVRLLDVHSTEGRYEHQLIIYMVFEHMDQDLDQFIRQCPPPGMDDGVIKDFLGQILKGVDWMHMNNIVHRDLKPQNILVSRDGKKIKIADFGLSRLICSNVVLSTQVVTQWYRAPEVLLHSSYSKEVDIWSVGCIFAEMINGKPLFAVRRGGEKLQLEEIFSIIGTPERESWPQQSSITPEQFVKHQPRSWLELLEEATCDAHDLLTNMLQFKGTDRITAEKALRHSYFSTPEASPTNSEGYQSPHRVIDSPPDHSPPSTVTILNTSSDSGIQES